MSFAKLGAAMLGASMLAVNSFAPPLGGLERPAFVDRAPEYDGLGRKKKIVPTTDHLRSRRSRSWREYAARVVATHSDREDPRDDKYLHSHARQMRGLRRALAARSGAPA